MQFYNHVYFNFRSTSELPQTEATTSKAFEASSSSKASKDLMESEVKGVKQPIYLSLPHESTPTGAPPTPPPSSISSQSPVRTLSTDEFIEGGRRPVYAPRPNDKKLLKCSQCPYTTSDENIMEIHKIANSHQSTSRKRKPSVELPCKFAIIYLLNFEDPHLRQKRNSHLPLYGMK